MNGEQYIKRVQAAMTRASPRARESVGRELTAHLEDHAQALVDQGCPPDWAETRAIAAMGDPTELGRQLNRLYPTCRWLALVILAVAALFCVLYARHPWALGVWCQREFLPQQWVGPDRVYAGEIDGQRVMLRLEPDGAIWYTCGDESRGPFTLEKAPDALPQFPIDDLAGVELREGAEVLFRGGWSREQRSFWSETGEQWFPDDEVSYFALMDLWQGRLVDRGFRNLLWPGLAVMALALAELLWGDRLPDIRGYILIRSLFALGPAGLLGAGVAAGHALGRPEGREQPEALDPWMRNTLFAVTSLLLTVAGAAVCLLGLYYG